MRIYQDLFKYLSNLSRFFVLSSKTHHISKHLQRYKIGCVFPIHEWFTFWFTDFCASDSENVMSVNWNLKKVKINSNHNSAPTNSEIQRTSNGLLILFPHTSFDFQILPFWLIGRWGGRKVQHGFNAWVSSQNNMKISNSKFVRKSTSRVENVQKRLQNLEIVKKLEYWVAHRDMNMSTRQIDVSKWKLSKIHLTTHAEKSSLGTWSFF